MSPDSIPALKHQLLPSKYGASSDLSHRAYQNYIPEKNIYQQTMRDTPESLFR